MVLKNLLIVGFIFGVHIVRAQPVADFSLPANACLNQTLVPENNSSNANSYFWDFNQGDLLLTPIAQNARSIGGISRVVLILFLTVQTGSVL